MGQFKRKFQVKKNIDIGRVISKLSVLALTLWVGSEILTAVASSMANTTNVFASGLKLIGFQSTTVGNVTTMTGTLESTGLIAVIGIIAVATLVLEFVEFKMG